MSALASVLSMYKTGTKIFPEKLGELSSDELLKLKEKVDADLAQISSQIDFAKSTAAASGEYADPGWFQRIMYARKKRGRLSQAIQFELGRKRRASAEANRKKHAESFEGRLLLAMDIVLPAELKQKVLDRARALEVIKAE